MRIDLHSHVLPGLDDGPADMEGSVALARAAAADGTTTLAATPHLRSDHPAVRPTELAARLADVRAALSAEAVEVELVAGGEVDVFWAHHASDEELRLASYGQRGSDILVEVPYAPLAPVFEDMLFTLTARGLRILLAHPERNPTFIRDPGRLRALVERGTLLQVTAAALASRDRRSRSHRLAVALVSEGLAHVIASDAHNAGNAGTPRSPSLAEGVEAAARHGPLRAEWMVTDAPAAILAGEPLPPAPADAGRRLGLLRGRRS